MIPTKAAKRKAEIDKAYVYRLFLKNERSMYFIAIDVVKEPYVACDIVSAACVTMMEKCDYLRAIEPQKQTAYILSIVKNAALMYLRQRRNEEFWPITDERILARASEPDEIDDALICAAEIEALQKALERLKPRDRDLLVMKYFEQLDDEAIAQQLGISKNSVRYYLTMARRALKAELKKEADLFG